MNFKLRNLALKVFAFAIGAFACFSLNALAAPNPPLPGYQGGTGFGPTTTAGNVGLFLQLSSSSPRLLYTFATATGGGGSGSVGTSTVNFFTFYNTATSVTGTAAVQFINGILTIATTTSITSSTITNLNATNVTSSAMVVLNLSTTNATTTNLSVSGALSLPNASVTNAALANSSLTVTAGTGLSGCGLVSLGGTITCSLATSFTVTSVTTTNFFTTNASSTNVTTTNLFVSGALNLPANSITDAMVVNGLTISGGTVDNSPIGATTPSTGVFSNVTSTNLNASGLVVLGNTTSTNLNVTTLFSFLNANGTNVTSTNLNVSGVTNLANTTITNATTTNLRVTSQLSVGATSTLSTTTIGSVPSAASPGNTILGISASSSNYIEDNLQNSSASSSASGCRTVTANNGNSSTFYGAFCINSSNYSDPVNFPVQGADDVSVDANGGSLILEAVSSTKNVNIMTGGTALANLRLQVTDSLVRIGTSTGIVGLDVNGTSTMQTTTIGHAASTTWQILAGGHMNTTSTIPTLSSCGTSPVINGSDLTGTITPGTLATTCTATFQLRYVNPHCTLSEQSMSVVNALSYSYTTSTLTMSQTGLAGQKLDYTCIDNF